MSDTFTAVFYSKAISISINVINFVLRQLLIINVKTIGEETRSEQTRSVKIAIFLTQFFNTAFLLLLFNANMTETSIPFFNQIFKGRYTDFNDRWYTDVGITIIKSMIIAAIFPLIEVIVFGGFRRWKHAVDRDCSGDIFRSKKKSIQQYVDVQVGPEYMIHYRYAMLLNISFVTLMYGTGMPFLFFIALFAFFTLYVLERLCIFFYYK